MNKKTAKILKKTKQVGQTESFVAYLNFLLTGQVDSEEQAEQVNQAAKRKATVSDATVVARAAVAAIDNKLTQLMEVVQIQSTVLEKLGATEEMFAEAEKEYEEKLVAVRKNLEAEAAKAAEEHVEATDVSDLETIEVSTEVVK